MSRQPTLHSFNWRAVPHIRAGGSRDTNCTGRIPRQFVSSVSCPSSIIQSCRPPVSHGLTSVVLGNARTHSTHEQKGAISLSEPPGGGPGPARALIGRTGPIRSRTWTRPSQMDPTITKRRGRRANLYQIGQIWPPSRSLESKREDAAEGARRGG